MNLAQRIAAQIARCETQSNSAGTGGGKLAVAVSGGLDSMVLLHAVNQFARASSRELMAIHIHHHARDAADRDAAFVRETCARWGIPAVVEHVRRDLIPRSERRGVEADLRTLRYRALADAARAHGSTSVFLAHHADDQVETVLWRLIKGTSRTGLAGMRAVTIRHGIRWVRPLLPFTRSEIEMYAAQYAIPHVEDESNADLDMTRNYLRHTVVPRLREIQPGLARAVRNTVEVLQAEDAYLDALAQGVIEQFATSHREGWAVDLPGFRSVALPLQRRAVKILLYCLASEEWTFQHVDSVIKLAAAEGPSAAVDLPGCVQARREYEVLWLGPRLEPTATDYEVRWRLEDNGHLSLPPSQGQRWTLSCRHIADWDGSLPVNVDILLLPVVREVVVRTVRQGDRIRPYGLGGSKKIHDVFVDAKIPRHLRGNWPIVCIGDDVVWVPGVARSQVAAVAPGTAEVWQITAAREPRASDPD